MMLINWIPCALKSPRGATRRRSQAASKRTRFQRPLERVEDRVVLSATLDLPASVRFNQGGVAAQLAPAGAITTTGLNILNGSLVLTEGVSAQAGDTLSIQNQGSAAGQIGITGDTVSYGGTAIGTFSGGIGGAPLTVTFNAASTATAATALLQDISFSTTNSASAATRDITGVLFDGSGGVAVASEVVDIIGLGPTVTLANNSVNTIAGSAGSLLASNATVSDASAANLNGGTLTATITNNASAGDALSIQNGNGVSVNGNVVSVNGTAVGTVSGGLNGAPLTVQFNSSAMVADAQSLVQHLQFAASANGSLAPRAISLQLTDGTNTQVGTASLTANVQAALGPVLSLPNTNVNFTLAGAAALVGAGAKVTDSSALSFAGGTLSITETANANANDVISVQSGNGIAVSGSTISYNGTAIGTLSGGLNGAPLQISFNSTSATAEAVQAVIQDLTFSTAGNLSLATRTLELQLSDGTNVSTASVNVSVAVNGIIGPVLTLPSGSVSVTAGGSSTVLGAGAKLSDATAVNFNNGTLVVSLPVSASTSDTLSIQSVAGITVNGQTVSFNGTAIGTVSGGTNGQSLNVALNANATVSGVQALLQSISLQAGASQAAGPLAIGVSLTDGSGATAATGTLTANIQAPVAAVLNVAGTINVKNSAAVRIGAGASITGINAANLNGATLNVQLIGGTSRSSLGVLAGTGVRLSGSKIFVNGHVVGSFKGTKASVAITFNSSATVANVTQVLNALFFRELGVHQGGNETIQMQFTDAAGVSSNLTSTTLTFIRGR
jgi:hypothetical protein